MRVRGVFLLAVLAVLMLVTADSEAQNAPAPPEKPDQLRTLSREELDVVKVLTAQERAWNEGNLEAYASAFKDSPETLFVAQKVTRGFDQIMADYKENYGTKEAMGTLSFAQLEPHVLDEHFAVLVGRYHLDRSKKAGGSADGMFTLVMEKTAKGWKIVVDHTT